MANNITRWREDNPPNTLMAIDPGYSYPRSKVPYCGAALFQWGMLVWVALIKCPVEVPPFSRMYALVKRTCSEANIARYEGEAGRRGKPGETLEGLAVEKPLIYRKGTAKPEDIVNLRGIYGAFMGGIEAKFYSGPTPEEWKGSIDGTILNERVCAVLNAAERTLLVRAQAAGEGGLSSHVLDAVGLGLFTLGRAGKAMVV